MQHHPGSGGGGVVGSNDSAVWIQTSPAEYLNVKCNFGPQLKSLLDYQVWKHPKRQKAKQSTESCWHWAVFLQITLPYCALLTRLLQLHLKDIFLHLVLPLHSHYSLLLPLHCFSILLSGVLGNWEPVTVKCINSRTMCKGLFCKAAQGKRGSLHYHWPPPYKEKGCHISTVGLDHWICQKATLAALTQGLNILVSNIAYNWSIY